MGGGGGVNGEGTRVTHIGQMTEEMESLDEALPGDRATLDSKAKDRAGTLWEIAFGTCEVRMALEAGILHPVDLRVFFEELRDGLSILDVPIHSKAEGFDALQGLPAVEGGLARSDVAQHMDARLDSEGRQARCGEACIDQAVVAWVGLRKVGKATGGVIEVAAVDDDPADASAMAADEFGGAVGDDVGAPFNRAEEVRSGEGVIEHQHHAVFLGDGGDFLDWKHADVGVAEGFAVDEFGVGLDGALEVGGVSGVDEGDGDAEFWEGVFELAVGAAVEAAAGDDVIAGVAQREDGLGLGGVSAAGGDPGDPALQVGEALLEHVGGGVHEPRVDVAQFLEGKQVCGVFGALKLVAGCLVNRHCATAGGDFGGIPGVQLTRRKSEGVGCFGHTVCSLSQNPRCARWKPPAINPEYQSSHSPVFCRGRCR